jgi:hypothetical protein
MEGHAFIASPCRTPVYQGKGDVTLSSEPVDHWVREIVEHYARQVKMAEQLDTDLVPVAKLQTATHIYAAAFGSPIKTFTDDNPCALPFVTTAEEADKIEEPDIWSSPGIARIFELGEKVQKELGPDAYLGPCDMQTGFDTACLIWDKSELYIAMVDPEQSAALQRLSGKCARFFKRVLTELRRAFPQMSWCHCPGAWSPPEMGPWMSNDECGAVSPPMFEQFMLPEMIDLAEAFGGIGMHCCADAEHQFQSFKKIPNFYGFNRVAAKQGYAPLVEQFDGSDQTPVMVLAWVPDDAMEMPLKRAPEGMRFIFFYATNDNADAKRWLDLARSINSRTAL